MTVFGAVMNKRFLRTAAAVVTILPCIACSDGADEPDGPPECGSFENGLRTVIAGPGQDGFDEALAAKAHQHDRLFAALFSHASGLNTEVSFSGTEEQRALIDQFVHESDDWDFEAATGVPPEDLLTWHKSTGLYAGAGLTADAYRYGVLRDSGADCQEIEIARKQLVRGLEAFDIVMRINGVPGVTSRSIINTNFPSAGARDPTPLFDENGDPLPAEKNNGEWRADQTGDYPGWVWEDSCSRDMLVGWAWAYATTWEVIGDDPTIPDGLKKRIQENAKAGANALRKVGESGYDLEIPDADGRLTLHAYLNENVLDRLYLPGANNGFHAVMALGIVGALAYVAEDPDIDAYLEKELIEARNLPKFANDDMLVVNVGVGSNFSNFNMAFTGLYIAQRVIDHSRANTFLGLALTDELYAKPDASDDRQPIDMGQSFFDMIYAAGASGSKAGKAGENVYDRANVDRGLETLRDFPDAPFWNESVENCDSQEIESGDCVLNDGTRVTVLGEVGWKGTLVAREIIPMAVRPSSNYFWRSTPYQINGGGGGNALYPAVDFRAAYWMGRWIRVSQ
jgi:hypothetical protein